ncbi:MAG: tetratricopeptide repeat protein [Bacteroidales bacterium]|jgi:signal transduction histidine kinase|nr:tetratricopeptide repeat protein [Bacteroidales bacterium]
MRGLFSTFLIMCFLFSFAQEDTYEIELFRLEQNIQDISESKLKISVYKDIIELSYPDHLDIVLKYSEELLKLSESLNNDNSEAFSNYYLGNYYLKNDNFENSEKYLNKALTLYLSLDNKNQIIEVYHSLGLVNQFINNYDAALSYYQKQIEVAELIGNNEKAALCYHDIGTLYNDLQEYSTAQNYYEKALEIYKQTNNEERIAAIYQNIGVLHYNWGNYDQSLEFYEKSLVVYEELQEKQNVAISLSNIGLVYEECENYDKALDYYQKALIIFEEIESKSSLVYIFYNLGSLYRNIKNYSKSKEYFIKGLNLSIELPMNDYISYNYEALSGLYEESGKYSLALDNYKKYATIKDSLFNEEKHKQIGEIEAQFQSAQHDKEIAFMKLDQELQDSRLKKKETQNLILILSSLLGIVTTFVLFLFARKQKTLSEKFQNEIKEKRKTEAQLNNIKNELEDRVAERTIDLESSNNKLIKEIEEHKSTMKNLEIAKNKAEEADRLKTNFLTNISHEVRKPMNSITGFSQMLSRNNLSISKRNEYINLVHEGCSSLTNLIDDIVAFATIESGQAKVEKKEFNPHPILEFLHDHFTNELVKLDKTNLILSYANENRDIDTTLITDAVRLKQILSILIDNAIKFTKSGHVEFGFVHPNKNEIQFFVKDTGVGIDEDYSDIIFERFRQVDESSTKEYKGAGIGLSVAKNLVGLLNGSIYFESTVGKGTTFFFSLPSKTLEQIADSETQPRQFDWKNKVILLAEDKRINYDLVKETLSITNVDIIWAKNGKEALSHVENKIKIDLILLDIQMPVMDGYECARQIKQITSNIPIVAQTAYALPQDSYKCFDAGCDDYISKPISLNQFLIKLDKYLA